MRGSARTLQYGSTPQQRCVAFQTHGPSDGTPIIALHSGPGFGAATLRPGIDIVAARHAITLIDLPGCGASSRHPGSGYPIEAYIEDVIQVRAAIGAAQPWLLGHGWGAILAVETALAHPLEIGGLVLVNPLRILNAQGQDGEAQARQVDCTDPTLLARFSSDVLPALQRALAGQEDWSAVDRNPWWPEMWRTQWAQPATADCAREIGNVELGMEAYFAHKGQAMFDAQSHWARYDLAARLGALACPVSVLASTHGANYVALPRIHVEPLRAVRPSMPIEIVDDAGHFLLAEAPALVAAHLQRWVR